MEAAFLSRASARREAGERRPLPSLPARPSSGDGSILGAPYRAPRKKRKPTRLEQKALALTRALAYTRDDEGVFVPPQRNLGAARGAKTEARGVGCGGDEEERRTMRRALAPKGGAKKAVFQEEEKKKPRSNADTFVTEEAEAWMPRAHVLYADRLRRRVAWEKDYVVDWSDWRSDDGDLLALATEAAAHAAYAPIRTLRLRRCAALTAPGFAAAFSENDDVVKEPLTTMTTTTTTSMIISPAAGLKDSLLGQCVEVDLTRCAWADDSVCEVLRRQARRVQVVRLDWTAVTDAGVKALFCALRALRDLSLRGCRVGDGALGDIAAGLRAFRTLRALDLRDCDRFSNDSLLVLMTGGGGLLRELRVAGCRQLDASGLLGLRRSAGQHELRILDCSGLSVQGSQFLSACGDSCAHLRELHLAGLRGAVDDTALAALSLAMDKKGPLRLETLDISGCASVTTAGLNPVLYAMRRTLRHLDVSGLALLEDPFCDALRPLRKLSILKMVDTPLIGDEGFERIFAGPESHHETCDESSEEDEEEDKKGSSVLVGRHHYHHRHTAADVLMMKKKKEKPPENSKRWAEEVLKWRHRRADGTGAPLHPLRELEACASITGGGTTTISAENCHSRRPKLPRYSVRAIRAVVSAAGPALLRLDVDGSPRFDDEALALVAGGCPELRKLGVASCTKVSDDGLTLVFRACRKLNRLRAASCGGTYRPLTDASALALAASCPDLAHCDLSRSDVREPGLVAIASGCAKLETLRVVGVDGVTDAAVQALLEGCPRLKTLDCASCELLTPLMFRQQDVAWWRVQPRVVSHLELHRSGHGLTDAALDTVAATWPHATNVERRRRGPQRGVRRGLAPVPPACALLADFQMWRQKEDAAAAAAQRRVRGCQGHRRYETHRAAVAALEAQRAVARALQARWRVARSVRTVIDLTRKRDATVAARVANAAIQAERDRFAQRELARQRRMERKRAQKARLRTLLDATKGPIIKRQRALWFNSWRSVVVQTRFAIRIQLLWKRRRRFLGRVKLEKFFAAARLARGLRRGFERRREALELELLGELDEFDLEALSSLAEGSLAPSTTSLSVTATSSSSKRAFVTRAQLDAIKALKSKRAASALRVRFWVARCVRRRREWRARERSAMSITRVFRGLQAKRFLVAKRQRKQAALFHWGVLCGPAASKAVAALRRDQEKKLQTAMLRAFKAEDHVLADAVETLRHFFSRSSRFKAFKAMCKWRARRKKDAATAIQMCWRRFAIRRREREAVRAKVYASFVIANVLMRYVARKRIAASMDLEAKRQRQRLADDAAQFKEAARRMRLERILEKCLAQGQRRLTIKIQRLWRLRRAAAQARALRVSRREAKLRGLRHEYAMTLKAQEAKAIMERVAMSGRIVAARLARKTAAALKGLAVDATNAAASLVGESEEDALRRANQLPPLDKESIADRVRRVARGDPDQREAEHREQLTNSILNLQTRSSKPRGIIDFAFTCGRQELLAMNEKQTFNRQAKIQPFFRRVKYDVSANKAKIFVWIALGTGPEVFTGVVVRPVPKNHRDKTANESRKYGSILAGSRICDHEDLATEIIGEMGMIRGAAAAPPVTEIAFARGGNRDEEAALTARGYTKLTGSLHGKKMTQTTALKKRADPKHALKKGLHMWILRRKVFQKPVLNRLVAAKLRKLPWFNDPGNNVRVENLVAQFALPFDQLLQIRRTFDKLTFSGGLLDPYVETLTWLQSLGEPTNDAARGQDRLTAYQKWLLELVEPKSMSHLRFVEYLHVVCTFSMFNALAIQRWLFKSVTGRSLAFLDKVHFDILCEALLANCPTPYSKVTLDRLFADNSTRHGELSFKKWCKICGQMPVLLFLISKFHDSVQRANCGTKFWYEKKEAFSKQRDRDEIERTGMNS